MTWRAIAREDIEAAGSILLKNYPDISVKEMRSEISKCYPWARVNWPYKVWCEELNSYLFQTFGETGRQSSTDKLLKRKLRAKKERKKSIPVIPKGQLSLFGDNNGTH
jgi:hypothetical protein